MEPVLDPLFGEYLRSAQESQMAFLEAKVESALQDKRLQSLVNVQPSGSTYDGPPMLPNYALIGLGAQIVKHLSSAVYSECTRLGCKLGEMFTQRRLGGFPPHIVFKVLYLMMTFDCRAIWNQLYAGPLQDTRASSPFC